VTPRRHALWRESALVVAEAAGQWPMPQDVTADFIYVRLHGDRELYRSGYSDRALSRWAQRIRRWHEGTEPSDAKRISAGGPPSKEPRDVYAVAQINTWNRLNVAFRTIAGNYRAGMYKEWMAAAGA
jgi:uncharacterized protein YecE (DUF72 family)